MAIKTALWLGSSIAGHILDKRNLLNKELGQYLPREDFSERLETGVPKMKKDRQIKIMKGDN